MIRRSAALVIVLGLATAACASGSDDAAPATTRAATTVPATDAPKTTPAPTTTTTTPPATTTTVAPTTTLDPLAEIEAAVKQAILDFEVAYFASASDPTDSALRESYLGFYAEGRFSQAETFLNDLVANGTSLRSSSTVAKSTTFPSPVEVLSGSVVAINVCQVDSDVIHVPATATAPEIIVDDRVLTTLTRTDLELIAGRWVLTGGTQIMQWNGVSTCEA